LVSLGTGCSEAERSETERSSGGETTTPPDPEVVIVSNVLSEEKKQQVIALGRLGWSLRRIQRETDVRRETISAYLKEAGVALRPPRGRFMPAKPASRAHEVTPDSGAEAAVPAAPESPPERSSSASVCEPHRETIEVELSKGRNAKAIWQDLVSLGLDVRDKLRVSFC